jgi:hypothetical protein
LKEEGARPDAVTCPECGARVRVAQSPAPWEDAEPDAVPTDPDWFVLVQTKQVGPLDARALLERVRSGEVHGRTFVWRDGFDGWRRALEVPELIPILEELGFPSTPPTGPLTPAEGLSPPGSTPPRAAQTPEIATPRRPKAPKAPAAPSLDAELELAREPRHSRTPAPRPDYVPRGLRRRSPWKLALALSAALAVPVGGLTLFVSARRQAPVVEASNTDTAISPPVAAPDTPVRRVQELRDMLLGKKPPPAPAPPRHVAPPESTPTPPPAKPVADGPKTAELRALYGDARKPDVGPRIRRSDSASATAGHGGGPSNEEVARVVGQTQSAFQSCIEQQLRKNAGFKGGKVSLVATVGTSGTVKQVQLDRHDLEGTELGDCLKARAKRMVFSSFSGDDVDVEIPLVLTTTL